LAPRYRAIIIQWEPPPPYIVRKLSRLNPNLVFDYDDPVFLGLKSRADFLIANSKVIIAGSQYLSDYSRTLNENVVIIPSSVPLEKFDLYRNKARNHQDSRVVVGWIGSDSTVHHIDILREVFEVLGKEYMLQLKLVGIGNRECPIIEKDNLEIVTVRFYNEDEMIRYAFTFDIGIVPLKETEAARGKTALKAVIYMAAGIPVVSSPLWENLQLIMEGVSGFFASTSEQWVEKLRILIRNESLRKKMGSNGLALVQGRYNTKICFELFYETLCKSF
jgi:glycosyltransferase involved in cell wall biosynthesis